MHRFALVYGSATDDPTIATTIYYADDYPYKQCGYKYNGYITSLFIISGTTAIGIVETRICKNDPKLIAIETYGEVAPSTAISLWFNKGTDTEPDWAKLNSTTSGTIMPYVQKGYTFKETHKKNDDNVILIDCCKKCPSCKCLTCPTPSLTLHYSYPAKINPILWRYYPDRHDKWNPTTTTIIDNFTTEYFYQVFNNQYLITRIINWDEETNTTITRFILEAVYISYESWLYYIMELRWVVSTWEVVPGRLTSPGGIPTPSIIDPFYGSIEGETLIGTDVRSGHSGSASPSSYLNYGYSNNGTNTALFSNGSFVEYKWDCNTIYFWIGDTGEHVSQNKIYYTHPDTGIVHLLDTREIGYSSGITTTSFPFDYLKTCASSFTTTSDGTTEITTSISLSTYHDACNLIGKSLKLYQSSILKYTVTISEYIDATTLIVSDVIVSGTYISYLSS